MVLPAVEQFLVICEDNGSLAAQPPLDQLLEFREPLKVEFSIENLVN
jgi:hypothetical protein